MDPLFKDKIKRADFENILLEIEEASSFSHLWLDVLNMNSVAEDLTAFFGEKVLVIHALDYCSEIYDDFILKSPIRKKVNIFNECFNLFNMQLRVLLELAELENRRPVISTDFPLMHYLLGLELLAMRNSLPGEDEIECRKSRFLKQYNDLQIDYNNYFYSPSLIGPAWLNNEITSWENRTPMNKIHNEIQMLHELHKLMEII
ncbi:expressed protein [Phakopsora pachyrhizi]|uniref:Expressed protein n=1 Tax=Phakopsora pachyrhizi TaxID=170000 RepID=A0AAV0B122_PHAPC|nr:expressed protein [Phakopsora pachyrhizi]